MLHSRSLSYFFAYVPTLLCLAGFSLGGRWAALNLVFVVVFLGLAEWLLPQSRSNEESPDSDIPKLILWLSLPATLLVLGSLLWRQPPASYRGGIWCLQHCRPVSTGVPCRSLPHTSLSIAPTANR